MKRPKKYFFVIAKGKQKKNKSKTKNRKEAYLRNNLFSHVELMSLSKKTKERLRKILIYLFDGKTISQIARIEGVSKQRISSILQKLEQHLRSGNKKELVMYLDWLKKADFYRTNAVFVNELLKGKNLKEASRATGTSYYYSNKRLERVLKVLTPKLREKINWNLRNWHKLRRDKLKNPITHLRLQGLSQTQIAKVLRISQSHVSKILKEIERDENLPEKTRQKLLEIKKEQLAKKFKKKKKMS